MNSQREKESKKPNWAVKNSTYLFKSSWYNLRQDLIKLPSGNEITYTYVEHPGSVFVVPLTANKLDSEKFSRKSNRSALTSAEFSSSLLA